MRKFQYLLFVLQRSHICYYIICMNVPLSYNAIFRIWPVDILIQTICQLQVMRYRKLLRLYSGKEKTTYCAIFKLQ